MEFYFQCAVVAIGVVGTAANALILYGLVASKQHKKLVLIFSQNVLDFISSVLLVVTYALKLCNFYLTGSGGYWFCMLLLSENLIWCAVIGSKTKLESFPMVPETMISLATTSVTSALEVSPNMMRYINLHFTYLLTIGPSLLLLPGTVCRNMSRPHPLCLFSEVASRLSSSGIPSHDCYRNFCSACTVTVLSFSGT